MRKNITIRMLSLLGIVLLGMVISYLVTGLGQVKAIPDASTLLPLSLGQADAIKRAIAIAPEHGIDLPRPSKIVALQMTLGEWDKLAGNVSGPGAAKFGLDPNQLVWVVTLIGDGFWAESSPSGSGGDKIDNITLVIGVATGRHIETRVLAPAASLRF